MHQTTNKRPDSDFRDRLSRLLIPPPFPEKPFVLSGAAFGDVYRMAVSLQADFRRLGPQPATVCLCTDNRAVMAAALLAALAGGVTLVLPYSYADNILEEIRQSMTFQAVIADAGRTPPGGIPVLMPGAASPSATLENLAGDIQPDAELLRLYTGGSTGKPQVWPKTANNLFSEAFFHADRLSVSPRDRLVATVPPNHIYGLLFSVLVPLVSAAGVVADTPVYPHEIGAAIKGQQATILVSIPMHYRVLNGCRLSRGSLRLALSSAGMLDPEDGRSFTEQTGTGVHEIYGSTETGGIAYRRRFLGEEAFTPFDTVAWDIREERLRVRSDYLSPCLPMEPDGFYRTGDRATPKGDRGFLLLGRADGVVKVGGRRVDLDEIRDKLKQIAGVRDAAVISIPVEMGRQNEIAALVEGELDVAHIRRELASMLPPFAFPRLIRVTPQLPRTAAGKFDRSRLEGLLKSHVSES